ncbi:hypothetical protein [Streptacidiphilus neutrinimicus]|nr:hypothetical protein [Streptacidiphilus neutrinimicus]
MERWTGAAGAADEDGVAVGSGRTGVMDTAVTPEDSGSVGSALRR